MHLRQIDVTGARLVGAITKELGHDGPKHHAVVLGQGMFDGVVYLAELMAGGYQIATFADFQRRYANNGEIRVEPNAGPHSNLDVAKRALAEIKQGQTKYDLVGNNCECFVNRAMHGQSTSTQVVNTALGILLIVGLIYVVKSSG
ncbi:MAG: hypothetical protein E6Q40_15125 [Cupriavidus sp.]|nr:MAG: hypothetical protein E6Q40_15125 [Cupriavidus sp.]